ncbi:spore coat protein X [Lentibacillus halodurans]|uniref:Spore coat protein X n=1 Tax=Lentibacillus halodurans TaxID=237679 RepID=A0A1I0Y0K3_9BACI|nr:spore coat protein [Lentibacillus halodurans]SFB05773.1 spore coat protein X [Lentibacillus halodurans]
MSHMTKTKWRALDHCDESDRNNATVTQDADQSVSNQQVSDEWIIIKDSQNIDVTTTDRQVAASLQLGIEAAIAVVINIAIADGTQSEGITQDFRQMINTRQGNRQKTIVEQSRDIQITTTDTDIAINIQLLFQILVAIVASLDIL